METRDNMELVKKLYGGDNMLRAEWHMLLTALTAKEKEYLRALAATVAEEKFGKGVYIRGLIEISSFCRNNCFYCGLRAANREAQRYRLTKEDILECCEQGSQLGFNTFVLQGGEDATQNDEWLTDVVRAIHAAHPDKAITLSVGERSAETYRAFRKAGADRYLLRHETRNDEHYSLLHPQTMSASKRRECLKTLKEIDFQTGSGMMIGSPGQTVEHLIDDIQFLEQLQPEMIGIGPFIPAAGTPFAGEPAGSIETTLLLISLLRLRFPDALIPATTALATLHPEGRTRAILAGANVVMPNLSPRSVRSKYSIYDNKATSGCEAAEEIEKLEKELNAIGYRINFARGDYKKKI